MEKMKIAHEEKHVVKKFTLPIEVSPQFLLKLVKRV